MSMEFKHPPGSVLNEYKGEPKKPEGLLPPTPTVKTTKENPIRDRVLEIYWFARDMLGAFTE